MIEIQKSTLKTSFNVTSGEYKIVGSMELDEDKMPLVSSGSIYLKEEYIGSYSADNKEGVLKYFLNDIEATHLATVSTMLSTLAQDVITNLETQTP